MANGLFIVFEGPDGAGKSTLLKMIEKQLFSQYPKLTCVYTREPGGTNNKIAEDIRHILIEKDEYQIDAYAETLLFAASRSQHVKDFIIPNLKANNVILCDRYVHSSLVYQGIARGLGIDNVWEINKFAIHGVLPHLTVLLMIKPDQAYDRMMKNRLLNNHWDHEQTELKEKIYDGYAQISKKPEFKNTAVIDASRDLEVVYKEVFGLIEATIKKYYGY